MILIGIVAITLKYEKQLTRADLSRRLLHLGNIYTKLFSLKDINFIIHELIDNGWIIEKNDFVQIKSTQIYYQAVKYCFPLLGMSLRFLANLLKIGIKA